VDILGFYEQARVSNERSTRSTSGPRQPRGSEMRSRCWAKIQMQENARYAGQVDTCAESLDGLVGGHDRA